MMIKGILRMFTKSKGATVDNITDGERLKAPEGASGNTTKEKLQ
jgi:hypothetical protein